MSGLSMSSSLMATRDGPDSKSGGPPKRKKRTKGTFPCEHCDKVYLRSDHLARHQLNHEPKVVYQCDFMVEEFGGVMRKCGKTFVRRDLKERHIKRHLEMREQELMLDRTPNEHAMAETESTRSKDSDDESKRKRRRTSVPSGGVSGAVSGAGAYDGIANSPLQISKLIHTNGGAVHEKPNAQYLQLQYPLPQYPSKIPPDNSSPLPPPQMHFPQTSPANVMQNAPYNMSPVTLTAFTPLPYNQQFPMAPPNAIPQQQGNPQMMGTNDFLDPKIRSTSGRDFYDPQSLDDPTDYKLNVGMPSSQNDILSWLFMDSSPNAVMMQQQQQQQQQQGNIQGNLQGNIHGNNSQNIPSNLQTSGQSINNDVGNIQNNIQQPPLQTIPDNRQISMTPRVGQVPAYPFNGNIGPTPAPDDLSSFYNVLTAFNNYGLLDTNIFQNDGNPLDDIFTKKYGASQKHGGTDVNNTPLSNSTLNHSNNSTSTSPSNSAESNVSPMNVLDAENASNNEYLAIQGAREPKTPAGDLSSLDYQLIHHAKHKNIKLNKHLFVDSLLVDSFTKLMPLLNRDALEEIMPSSFEVTIEDRLSFYLYYYWSVFHPQFTVLHKPSFDTKLAEPHLVLAMIVVGCQYAPHDDNFQENVPYRDRKKLALFKLSEMIITPLRFLIFQHEEFKSPVKLWILQSLNMIEWCEKNFLSRHLHERAHLHHGTTVQLLRRSPLLGGNPSKKSKRSSRSLNSSAEEESDLVATDSNETAAAALTGGKVVDEAEDYDMFVKWVELELMKRVTFMTFYMDIMDYVKYRHNPQIMFYQLQLLNLPCDDEFLWESRDANGSFKKIVKQQRKLLHRKQQQQLQLDQQQKFKVIPETEDPTDLDKASATIKSSKPETVGTVAARAMANNIANHSKPSMRNGKDERFIFSDSFLSALKALLKLHGHSRGNGELHLHPSTSLFRKKILFAGLTSIMFQMQQTDIQKNTFALTTGGLGMQQGYKDHIWKEIIAKVLDNWNVDVNGDCTHVIVPRKSLLEQTNILTQCKFPMYHLVQIIGISDINQYDIAIYGGSPGNMSVDATSRDYYIVERKLKMMWSKNVPPERRTISNLINLKCVIHCYLFLWELMLQPLSLESIEASRPQVAQNTFLDWDINHNYFDRMYTISTVMLVLWCYCFSTSGPESNRFDELFSLDTPYENLVETAAENGYEYLLRIRMEFSTNLRKNNLHHDYNIHPFKLNNNKHTMHEVMTQYCNILPQITNKQNILGLCFLVGKKLLNSQCEILRENAKLILNCGFRSIGKKSIYCMDLFDNEFNE